MQGSHLIGLNGPFWSRETYLKDEEQVCPQVEAVAKLLGVEQIVAGHNPQVDLR